MHRFWGVVKYEYRMSTRRWGFWLAYTVVTALYLWSLARFALDGTSMADVTWGSAGLLVYELQLFLPVVAGILLSDRIARDTRLGTQELLRSTPLSRRGYLLGKYVGNLLAVLTPPLILIVALGLVSMGMSAPFRLIPMMLAAYVLIVLPAYIFITLYALAFPLVMPVRVFQVLFTGFWFWANYFNSDVIPDLHETLLMPAGVYALEGIFRGAFRVDGQLRYTSLDAMLNWGILALFTIVGLVALDRLLAARAAKA